MVGLLNSLFWQARDIDVGVLAGVASRKSMQEVLAGRLRTDAEFDGMDDGAAVETLDSCEVVVGEERLIGVGEEEDDVGLHAESHAQGLDAIGAAFGGDGIDEGRSLTLALIVAKDHLWSLVADKVHQARALVEKDDLKLMHGFERLQAGNELAFGRGERAALELAHARRAIEDIDEARALAFDAKDLSF